MDGWMDGKGTGRESRSTLQLNDGRSWSLHEIKNADLLKKALKSFRYKTNLLKHSESAYLVYRIWCFEMFLEQFGPRNT